MMPMRCIHCPTSEKIRCAGLDVRRFCELIDPTCPDFDPGYLSVIAGQTRAVEEDTDIRIASTDSSAAHEPIIHNTQTIGFSADCCGGGVPHGVFDGRHVEPVSLSPELDRISQSR